ncbi:hypothetical protein ACIOWK_35020, partial [Pseudomonas protegens]|uniref:hypothetical protein n=1 Tax=Pseudomonas protegens TaxID=380021 RepID=UPI0037FCE8E4
RSLRHYTSRVRQQCQLPPDSNTTASAKPGAVQKRLLRDCGRSIFGKYSAQPKKAPVIAGVGSGWGRNDTLSSLAMSADDFSDSVFANCSGLQSKTAVLAISAVFGSD